MSKALIAIGIICIAVGITWNQAPWLYNWFGKLPGDIDIRNDGSRIFIPITSMIIISVIISLVFNFLFRK